MSASAGPLTLSGGGKRRAGTNLSDGALVAIGLLVIVTLIVTHLETVLVLGVVFVAYIVIGYFVYTRLLKRVRDRATRFWAALCLAIVAGGLLAIPLALLFPK